MKHLGAPKLISRRVFIHADVRQPGNCVAYSRAIRGDIVGSARLRFRRYRPPPKQRFRSYEHMVVADFEHLEDSLSACAT